MKFRIKCKFKEGNEFTQLNFKGHFKGHTVKVYKIKKWRKINDEKVTK